MPPVAVEAKFTVWLTAVDTGFAEHETVRVGGGITVPVMLTGQLADLDSVPEVTVKLAV